MQMILESHQHYFLWGYKVSHFWHKTDHQIEGNLKVATGTIQTPIISSYTLSAKFRFVF